MGETVWLMESLNQRGNICCVMLMESGRWMDGVAQAGLINGHEILSTTDGNDQPLQTSDENCDSTELAGRKNYFGRGIKG